MLNSAFRASLFRAIEFDSAWSQRAIRALTLLPQYECAVEVCSK